MGPAHEHLLRWDISAPEFRDSCTPPHGKDKVLGTWIRDVIAHDLGRRAPFIDVVAPGCARVLMSARSRSSHVLAVSSSFKHILY